MARTSRAMITVRPVTADDDAAWLQLRRALWPEGSEAEHREEIERFFARGAREPAAVLLALEGGRAIGLADAGGVGQKNPTSAYLEGWFVAAEARGRGVGRALTDAAEEWGRLQGCRELASDAEADNDASAAAHRALGFTEVGLVRCFRKDL